MPNAEFSHYLYMALAIALEVAANILIQYSDGMRRRLIAALGILSILASFSALAQAVKGIELSIAYALWGGTGILLTAMAGLALFRQRLTPIGWTGIVSIVLGMSVLKLA